MIASNSPFAELNNITMPIQRLPGSIGSFSRRMPPPLSRHATMSDEKRSAAVPKCGLAPLMLFR